MEKKEKIIKRLRSDISRLQRKASNGLELISMLEFRREQYGFNRREFAALLGIQNTHYSDVIHNKRRLPLEARMNAYAIGVPAEFLLRHEQKITGR